MPFPAFSRGLSPARKRRIVGAEEKMGLPWDAYYVLTKAEARMPNSKVHPNSGAPNYNIAHNVSDLTADADLDLGAYTLTAGKLEIDNITINGAAITSDTGQIDFGNEHLKTTGNIYDLDYIVFSSINDPPITRPWITALLDGDDDYSDIQVANGAEKGGTILFSQLIDGYNKRVDTWTAPLSYAAQTASIDDVFLRNDANDTTTGTITAAGFTTDGTVQAEQLTSTDDITMQGHLLTLGDGTDTIIEIAFEGSSDDGLLEYRPATDLFYFGNSNIQNTGTLFTGEITATSYDGVLAANLLDKTATETITGAYTFENDVVVAVGNASWELSMFTYAGTDFPLLTPTAEGGTNIGMLVGGLYLLKEPTSHACHLYFFNQDNGHSWTMMTDFDSETLCRVWSYSIDDPVFQIETSVKIDQTLADTAGALPNPFWVIGKPGKTAVGSGEGETAPDIILTCGAGGMGIGVPGGDGANIILTPGAGGTGTVAGADGTVQAAGELEVSKRVSSGTLTVTASANNTDVSGVNTMFVNITGNIILDGLSGGVDGQTLEIVYIGNYTNTVTIEDTAGTGDQDFYTHTRLDETIDGGGYTFVCNGSDWYDCSHARHV